MLLATVFFCGLIMNVASLSRVHVLDVSTLGNDPQTINRLNGEAFQQDALVTFNGWQYSVFYVADATNASVRHPSVSRRAIKKGDNSAWNSFTLRDYNQTEDDGHDVISLGISSDGVLHIIFDQHDNDLHYRSSNTGVASGLPTAPWSPEIFSATLNYLPGLEMLDQSTYFVNITYPRFLSVPSSSAASHVSSTDLLLEMRVGRSGLGDDWLYKYTTNHGWTLIGRYLEGVNNNAYINGLDFDAGGRLHVTWTYRDYVNDTGQDVAVQAGPNGPENNHDMDYALSGDLGATWQNNWGQIIGNCTKEEPILPDSAGITVFSIPKYGGILNQEAQVVDSEGQVHVLNRENTTGIEQWYHYWRSTETFWTRTPFPLDIPGSMNNVTQTPTVIGKRGKLVASPHSKSTWLLAVLPSNAPNSTALTLLASTAAGRFKDWNVVWEAESGCLGEPLFDRYRLDTERGGDGVLSLFVINGTEVQVIDLDISAL